MLFRSPLFDVGWYSDNYVLSLLVVEQVSAIETVECVEEVTVVTFSILCTRPAVCGFPTLLRS